MNAKMRRELEEAAKAYIPTRKSWTKEDNEILKEFYGKVPMKFLADKLGRSIKSMQVKIGEIRNAN
jgi:hypothetical protein